MNITDKDILEEVRETELLYKHKDTAYKAGVLDAILGMILVTTVIGLVVAAIGICTK